MVWFTDTHRSYHECSSEWESMGICPPGADSPHFNSVCHQAKRALDEGFLLSILNCLWPRRLGLDMCGPSTLFFLPTTVFRLFFDNDLSDTDSV